MDYPPVVHAASPPLQVTALAGGATVVLGFDLADDAAAGNLLGFAVRRVALVDGAEAWLKNPLKFARAPYAGYQIAGTDTRQAPIQQFHWIDEGVQPDQSYRYTVVTLLGAPDQPQPRDTCALEVRTAAITDGVLSLVFNRGLTATPAYRTLLDNLPLRPTARAGCASARCSCCRRPARAIGWILRSMSSRTPRSSRRCVPRLIAA